MIYFQGPTEVVMDDELDVIFHNGVEDAPSTSTRKRSMSSGDAASEQQSHAAKKPRLSVGDNDVIEL